MTATPPHQNAQPHTSEPTDEQLKQARRIASRTGQTVEQVLAEAIKRGLSAQMTAALVNGPRISHSAKAH